MFKSPIIRITLIVGMVLAVLGIVLAFTIPGWGMVLLVFVMIILALMIVVTKMYWAYTLFELDENQMRHQMKNCPQCDAPIYHEDVICPYCKANTKQS